MSLPSDLLRFEHVETSVLFDNGARDVPDGAGRGDSRTLQSCSCGCVRAVHPDCAIGTLRRAL